MYKYMNIYIYTCIYVFFKLQYHLYDISGCMYIYILQQYVFDVNVSYVNTSRHMYCGTVWNLHLMPLDPLKVEHGPLEVEVLLMVQKSGEKTTRGVYNMKKNLVYKKWDKLPTSNGELDPDFWTINNTSLPCAYCWCDCFGEQLAVFTKLSCFN